MDIMIKPIMSISAIIFGFLLLVFCKMFAKMTSDFYYYLLHYRFKENHYQVGFILAGVLFVIFGFLSLFGIIK